MFEARFNFFEVLLLVFGVAFACAWWVLTTERRRMNEREMMMREISDLRSEVRALRGVVSQHFPNELSAVTLAP